MAMNIEIMETYGDYTALTSGDAPFNSYWILGGSSNASFGPSTLDASDRALLMRNASNGFSSIHTRMFAAPVTKVTMSAGFNVVNLTDFSKQFEICDASGNAQLTAKLNPVGKFVIYGEGGAELAVSEGNYTTGVIYRICLRAEIVSANVVNVACSINGFDDPGLTVTGDFMDATAETFGGVRTRAVVGSPAGTGGDWDLLHLQVGTGECVDWGPLELVDFTPNVDIVKEWTPSTGVDNFANVDEAQPNADTDYNSSETTGQKDIFGFADGEVPESVVCIGLVSWARKEDSATRKFKQLLRVGGVDYSGVDIFAAETYGRFLDTWELNPDTVAPWDPSELAALEAGYEYIGA